MENEDFKPAIEDFTKIYYNGTLIKRHVVCAANQFHNKDDHINPIIVCGARHWDTIMSNVVDNMDIDKSHQHKCEQGFIDQYGIFITREEAREIVIKNEQPLREGTPLLDILFSENLY
tara:strand:+ start:742 stop:1095 length:354 start_codon:yes stop_codon:yes gene_type:complete